MDNEISEGEQQPGNQQNENGQPLSKDTHLLYQWRGQCFHFREQTTDTPDLGISSGRHHHAFTLPGGDQRAGKRHAGAITQRRIFCNRSGMFFDRHGFAGENRFLHAHAMRGEQPQIGWHFVTRFEQHDVARNQLFPFDVGALAAANDIGMRG